jgi:hypothetical protein
VAHHEADREDLWAEAVAMTSRAELVGPAFAEPILVGFRNNGWFSIYFGQDVMLQFTAEGELRRAYRLGELLRTQGTTLARLVRRRSDTETVLARHDLSAQELAAFEQWTRGLVAQFAQQLAAGTQMEVRREINCHPEPLLDRVAAMLQRILQASRFLAPAIRGKR